MDKAKGCLIIASLLALPLLIALAAFSVKSAIDASDPVVKAVQAEQLRHIQLENKLQEQNDSQKAERVAPLWDDTIAAARRVIVFGSYLLLAAAIPLLVALYQHARDKSRIHLVKEAMLVLPDSRGNWPILLAQAASDPAMLSSLALVHERLEGKAKIERARNPVHELPPMLRSYAPKYGTNAPRYTTHQRQLTASGGWTDPPREAQTASRKVLKLSNYIDQAPTPRSVLLGISRDGPVWHEISVTKPNGIVGGSTGSGKSNFLQGMARMLIANNTPQELALYLIDPKNAAFTAFKSEPCVGTLAISEIDWIGTLTKLNKERSDRQAKLAALGKAEWQSGLGMPFVVVLIDEMQNLVKNPDAFPLLLRLMGEIRSSGGGIWSATSLPNRDTVPSELKANASGRVCFSLPDPQQQRTVLGVTSTMLPNIPGIAKVRRGDIIDVMDVDVPHAEILPMPEANTDEQPEARPGWEIIENSRVEQVADLVRAYLIKRADNPPCTAELYAAPGITNNVSREELHSAIRLLMDRGEAEAYKGTSERGGPKPTFFRRLVGRSKHNDGD